MKRQTAIKSAFVWGISLVILLVLVTVINWFVYPFTSANPNFNDVETVFDSIQVPGDWTVIEQSENRGIAGRQCPIESERVCFLKEKIYKLKNPISNQDIAQGYSGCMGVSMNGTQDSSRSVASFPSRSPLRMAVRGRQKP